MRACRANCKTNLNRPLRDKNPLHHVNTQNMYYVM